MLGEFIKDFEALIGSLSPELRNLFRVRTDSALRGHQLVLEKPRSHTSIRLQFFSNRVINAWNKLPSNVVEAKFVTKFKLRLDESWPSLFPDLVKVSIRIKAHYITTYYLGNHPKSVTVDSSPSCHYCSVIQRFSD